MANGDFPPWNVLSTWPSAIPFTPAPQGWECPKCGRVYSPSMIMCSYCPQQPVTTTGTNTGTACTCSELGYCRLHRQDDEVPGA
jgi:hypothetical protein